MIIKRVFPILLASTFPLWLIIIFSSFLTAQANNIDQNQLDIYTITGQVTGPDGPLVDIEVLFDCCATEWGTRTDANGFYTFTTDGPQMSASIIAVPPLDNRLGQEALKLDVVSDISDVNFHLEPGNLLAGRVINQNGIPANLDHDLLNSQGAKQSMPFGEYAGFMLYLPPDEYSLGIGLLYQNWENHSVDLRTGDVTFWEVVINVDDEYLPTYADVEDPPPLVEKISIGIPDSDDFVHVVGAAGAITGGIPYLDIINLHTGNFTTTLVLPDGSFEANILAPYGSALQLRHNTWKNEYNRSSDTGAILWIYPPDMTSPDGETQIYLSGRAGDYQGYWTATGTINEHQFDPGDPFTATLDIMITSPQVNETFDGGEYRLVALLNFERIFDADGYHHSRVQRGTSTSFTPTGLPIDSMSSNRWQDYTPLTLSQEAVIQATHRTGDTLLLSFDLTGKLPLTMPHGYYRPALVLLLGPEEWRSPLANNSLLGVDMGLEHQAELGFDENGFANYLPVIGMGDPAPPRLPWALLVNTFSNGVRGAIAQEEQDQVGLSNRIAFQNEQFIVPPRTRYGQVIPYRLEPFIPTLASSLASDVEPYPPIIPLNFPGGELSVTISRPDGGVKNLGSAPFRQARNGMENSRYVYYIGADRTLQKVYEATTLSDQFVYEFEQYGRYSITMNGEVEDVWGNTYQGGGTYDVWAAETLDLEPAVFPGQPFEVGDPLATSVIVQPSVAATVTINLALVPGNGIPITYTVSGKANHFGYFQPAGDPFIMPVAGEYVLDVTAEYWDDQGTLWVGSSRGAGVVETPDSPLVAHGLRGITKYTDDQLQWFLTSQIHPKGLKENDQDTPEDDGFMMLYPYHTGDILWVSDKYNSIIAELSIHDQAGWYGNFLQSREEQVTWGRNNRSVEERITLGELPLVSTTSSGYDWSIFDEEVDQWGYAYLSVQRPGVSVRGYVATDNLFRTYWSTDYKYDRQLGNGDEGELFKDIKLHYGGAVIRTADHKEYLGYASMEVLIPLGQDELGIRTFPPFQGFSGGPDGGPILSVKGEDVDLFITPTALRPGSILEVGDTVAIAGTIWPTIDSKGWFTFTAPSGAQRVTFGQANRFGYFYAADDNFVVDERGVWTVEARLIHDTVVPSTGLPPTGHNTGDLLGARMCTGWTDPVGCGKFYFYVIHPSDSVLVLDIPRLYTIPGRMPITFEGNVPSSWLDVVGKFSTIMSGYILEEGDLTVKDGKFRYTFDPWLLHQDFPNLDVVNQQGIANLVDTFTFSFILSGVDKNGVEQHSAQSVVLQGQWLQALSGPAQQSNDIYLPMVLN